MPQIKTSKQELKRQRDALARYQRYLPTLLLKKQQLQLELRQAEAALEAVENEEAALRQEVAGWVQVLAEPAPLGNYLKLETVSYGSANIAGVTVPTLEGVRFMRFTPDLYMTPPWWDEALATLESLLTLKLKHRVLSEQYLLLAEELRLTNQRVNLFEKVKIPEAQGNIRVIRIALGDQQAAEVVRAKIAKTKTANRAVAS